MQDKGPLQPGQPGYGQSADPGQSSQEPPQQSPQPPQQPGRRVIEQPYGPPIIIEEPALPPTPPLAQTVRANSQPPGAQPPFTPATPPVQSPPPQAPAQGYGAPYQVGGQPPYQQGFQTQVPPTNYPPTPPQGYPLYGNAPVAPGNVPPTGYPPTGYPGGSFPPGGYPPQGGPRRGGLPPWAPIAGIAAVVVIAFIFLITHWPGPGPSPTVVSTSTPKPTNTAKPTNTPTLSGTMDLGSDWTKDSNGNIIISGAKNSFSATDTLAWVANLDQQAGALQAQIRCVRISTDGTEAVIYTETYDIADAADTVLAEKYNSSFNDANGNPESAATVTNNGPTGKYRLEFVVNGVLRADATFTYTG